ncbi:GNAT family N-acetyltransferase [Virgibacillus oceani]
MKIKMESSVKSYLEKVETLLLEKEACNNLILGLLDRLQSNKMNCYLGYVEENGRAVSAFMRTPPHNWIIADVEGRNKDVSYAIADYLYEGGLEVPGVLGPVSEVEAFVHRWADLKNTTAAIHMNQLIYQLDEVKITPSVKGQLVNGTEDELELIAAWLVIFGVEANEPITAEKAENMAYQFVKNQSIYLWKVDNQFVSMINRSRKTKNGATINAVFTPDQFKRKGYATNAVAVLSQQLLDKGFQFCSLYTDQSNQTSNNIYKKIGYYAIGSSIVYHFGKRE